MSALLFYRLPNRVGVFCVASQAYRQYSPSTCSVRYFSNSSQTLTLPQISSQTQVTTPPQESHAPSNNARQYSTEDVHQKMAAMKKFVAAGRKVTRTEYSALGEVRNSDGVMWLELIKTAFEGRYFKANEVMSYINWARQENRRDDVISLAKFLSQHPALFDSRLHVFLVSTLKLQNAPKDLVQSIIHLRPSDTDQKKEQNPEGDQSDLGKELGQIYTLSNDNDREGVVLNYKQMRKTHPNYVPDLVTFTRIAHALGPPIKNWPLTWELIQSVLKSPDVSRDVLFYNVALRALTYCDEPNDADLRIAQEMMTKLREEGIKPNKDTYRALMDVYFRSDAKGRVMQGIGLLASMVQDNVEVDRTMLSRLVKRLIETGHAQDALDVLAGIKQKESRGMKQLYTYIEEAFVREGDLAKAAEIRHILEKAKSSELGGELETAVLRTKRAEDEQEEDMGRSVLKAINERLRRKEGEEEKKPRYLDNDVDNDDGSIDDALLPLMTIKELHAHKIATFERFRAWKQVVRAFEAMVQDPRVSRAEIDPFSFARATYAKAKLSIGSEPLKWVESMVNQYKVAPHHMVVHALIRGLAEPRKSKLENVGLGELVISSRRASIQAIKYFARKFKILISKASYDLLIGLEDEEDIPELLKKMQRFNILDDRAYVAIVKSNQKNSSGARQAIRDMQSQSIPISLVVHNAMLQVYMNAGQCEEAIKYFDEMRALFATPNIDTYEILVLGFIKHGRFKDALAIFGDLMHKSSSFPPTPEMVAAIVRHLIRMRDGDLLFRLLRDVRVRHVKPTQETYEAIARFVLEQNDFPVEDLKWILGHASGDGIEFSKKTTQEIETRIGENENENESEKEKEKEKENEKENDERSNVDMVT